MQRQLQELELRVMEAMTREHDNVTSQFSDQLQKYALKTVVEEHMATKESL